VLTRQRRKDALALAKSLEVKLIVHASFTCPNIAMIHEEMRIESIRQLEREIELAHDLESDVITIHPGSPRGHVHWYDPDHFWKIMADSYHQLLAYAEPLGVRICTENIDTDFVGTEEGFARVFELVDSPEFGITFDFGHHNLIYKDRPLPERTEIMRRILRRYHDRVWVLHIHDNRGERDDHDALGSGEVDYRAGMNTVIESGIKAYWSMELSAIDAARKSRDALAPFAARCA
jgi:sugar phosphate isomerase/epimerase